MKKTKINLLTYKSDYKKIEQYFSLLRFSILIISVLLFIIVTFFYLFTRSKDTKINDLLTRKKKLLESIQDKRENEAKIIIIQKKYQAIKNFLGDDTYFLPYYNLLSSSLTSSTGSAKLENIQIDKQRKVDFIVSFIEFNEMSNFLKFVESPSFLKNFEKLWLKSFSALGTQGQKEEKYALSFYGQFIKINEIEN